MATDKIRSLLLLPQDFYWDRAVLTVFVSDLYDQITLKETWDWTIFQHRHTVGHLQLLLDLQVTEYILEYMYQNCILSLNSAYSAFIWSFRPERGIPDPSCNLWFWARWIKLNWIKLHRQAKGWELISGLFCLVALKETNGHVRDWQRL